MKPMTLAFDVYGTLINTHGVVAGLADVVGEQAAAFSSAWRDKQLEYSFRRGLMRCYDTFAVCTADALEYTCAVYNTALSAGQKTALLETYRTLPPFADVKDGLQRLQNAGNRLFAFSNGRRADVDALLSNAGLRHYFIDIVSVDDINSFKPDPAVYHHFLRQADAAADTAWLISSNPFDVIGAIAAGMKAAWIKRSPHAVFDPWRIAPTVTVAALNELPEKLK